MNPPNPPKNGLFRLVAPLLGMMLPALAALGQVRDTFPSGDLPALPEPNPIQVEVPRGKPVWITLSAYSLTSPIIRYRIERPPNEGRLGPPRMVTPDTAAVEYIPPPGNGPAEDGFAYQVQSEAGVSASAEVTIWITDKQPILIAPDEIDFGQVLPGATSKRPLTIQNIGGGMAEGEIRVPDGWSVEGDPQYHMAGGQKQTFTIVFSPGEERKYTGDIEYTGDLQRATDLDGVGVAPFAVTPGMVELGKEGDIRSGSIEIENRTGKAGSFRVTASPGLEADGTTQVPPQGNAEIVVRAKGGQTGEIRGQVTVAGEGIDSVVQVHAAAAPIQTIAAPAPAPSPAARGPAPEPAVARVAAAPAPAQGQELSLPPLGIGLADAMPQIVSRISRLEVQETGKAGARLTCNFIEPARSYRVEVQTVMIDAHGVPQPLWLPFTNASVQAAGSAVVAVLDHLQPGCAYVFRLAGLDDQGRVVAISSAGQVVVRRVIPGLPWGWIWLGAAFLGLAGWVWRRHLPFVKPV